MKQQLEGEELVQGLYEVRSLLIAMDNVNKEESKLKEQVRQEIIKRVQRLLNSKLIAIFMALLAAVFVVLTLGLSLTYTPSTMSDSRRAYEKALVDDEFDWTIKHSGDGETYPGYQGSAEKPYTFVTAYIKSIPKSGIIALVMVIIAGAVIIVIHKHSKKFIRMANKISNKLYILFKKRIRQIIETLTQRAQPQIEAFHERKRQISKEFLENLCKWYPKEYAFMEAVEFFIHELDIGTATTLPEAIKNFREDQYRKNVVENQEKMINNQKTMINNQIIMINNQKIMISKQNEMIRQQMVGNCIAAATFSEVQNISSTVSNIDANTRMTANRNTLRELRFTEILHL